MTALQFPVNPLQVVVGLLIGQGLLCSAVHLILVRLEKSLVDLGRGRGQSRGSNELLSTVVSAHTLIIAKR